MNRSLWLWGGFNLFIVALLALDLGVFHRRAHALKVREALAWTAAWVALALAFNAGLWFWSGPQKALEFFAAYVLEKSLSVDNLFVFALVFTYFGVTPKYQHKVLFCGIIGALVMRGTMIALGTALIHRFSWIHYIFGAFLVLTGLRLAFKRGIEITPDQNLVVRIFRRILPVCQRSGEQHFFVREAGKIFTTPLLLVLVCVEITDLMFATDSIPAIFAVTVDPFVIYTSNVFALLGLRSLYFVLAGVIPLFHYLKPALSVVLGFVGTKMLLAHTAWKIGTLAALIVVATVLFIAIVASIIRARRRAISALSQVSAPNNSPSMSLHPLSYPRRL
jgi:tellurite resistance protein TerC